MLPHRLTLSCSQVSLLIAETVIGGSFPSSASSLHHQCATEAADELQHDAQVAKSKPRDFPLIHDSIVHLEPQWISVDDVS